jgi:acyl carrier protein
MSTIAIVEGFIVDKVLYGGEHPAIDPDQDLITTGLLDSLAIMQLILFVEERFGVPVADVEVIPDNFRTLNMIKSFIERKQAAQSQVAPSPAAQ